LPSIKPHEDTWGLLQHHRRELPEEGVPASQGKRRREPLREHGKHRVFAWDF